MKVESGYVGEVCERNDFFGPTYECVQRIRIFGRLKLRNKLLVDAEMAEISIRRSFVP